MQNTFFYTPAIQDSGAPLQKVSHNATVGVECHQKNWDLGEDYSYAIPGNLSEMHPQSTNRLTCISQLWPDKTMPVRSCRRLWPKWRNVLMPFFFAFPENILFLWISVPTVEGYVPIRLPALQQVESLVYYRNGAQVTLVPIIDGSGCEGRFLEGNKFEVSTNISRYVIPRKPQV